MAATVSNLDDLSIDYSLCLPKQCDGCSLFFLGFEFPQSSPGVYRKSCKDCENLKCKIRNTRRYKEDSEWAEAKKNYGKMRRKDPNYRAPSRVRTDDYYKQQRLNKKIKYDALRKETFLSYGNCCVCCMESNIDFLTIDHINNDGGYLRKNKIDFGGVALYTKLKKLGYPKDNYRILCMNCNWGRAKDPNKVCPHKKEK